MATVKKAAKAIHEGYEKLLKSHKDLSVTHSSTEEGIVNVKISGTQAAIDSAYKSITADTHKALLSVQPDRTIIHQADLTLHEGSENQKSIAIHHVITTY